MDTRGMINEQIAMAQAELRQHETALQNAQAGVLQCMGALRGFERLLQSLDLAEAENAVKAPDAPYIPVNGADYHG